MSEQPKNNNGDGKKDRKLSEISHLFLSSVRERQTQGAPPPVRKAPAPRADLSIDLTPEEFAQMYGETASAVGSSTQESKPKVTAIIGAHLNGKLFDRVKEYASHLCGQFTRVGLIEVDAAELRLMLFERSIAEAMQPLAEAAPIQVRPEEFDLRRMTEALEELSWDVEQWLLLLPSPRSAQSQALLREVDQWVLLSTCDHDGLVAGYRTLKGMTEVQEGKPALSLALLDATSDAHAQKVYQKLASVSQQFLNWPMANEAPVGRRSDVAEHLVLLSRAGKDAAAIQSQGLAAPQWQAVKSFLARGKMPPLVKPQPEVAPMPQPSPTPAPAPQVKTAPRQFVADVVVGQKQSAVALPNPQPQSQPVSAPAMVLAASQEDDVIDLAAGESSSAGIISGFMRSAAGHWLECPVKPPMCPDATVAVGRDRRLLIIAVAHEGLKDLRAIGRAYQWLTENRALVAMAIPQLSIDAAQSPRLHLLVDQTDLSAEILQPMLQSSNVTVQAYRKLRWAGRTGLLLNAA